MKIDQILSRITKGHFQHNLEILTRYELILECKYLNIHHYTGLDKTALINKIAKKRKSMLLETLVNEEEQLALNRDLLVLLLDFIDFTSNVEELQENRYKQIEWAKERQSIQRFCQRTDNDKTFIKWLKYHNYDQFGSLEPLYTLKNSSKQLWQLYLQESYKMFILSLPFESLFLSEYLILEWFRLLFYKGLNKKFFENKKKFFPAVDHIRQHFVKEYNKLSKQYPAINHTKTLEFNVKVIEKNQSNCTFLCKKI